MAKDLTKIRKTIGLLLNFYKNFFLAAMVITGACVYLFFLFGWGIFGSLLWFKLASFAIIYMFSLGDKKKENYYYHNLGLGRVYLWGTTFTIDFLIFILAIIITFKVK